MADPKTIIDYATKRRDDAVLAVTAAQQRLADTQSELALANSAVTSAAGELSDLERKAAEIRQKLSVIETPADGEALLEKLEQAIIRIRAQQATIVIAKSKSSVAQAEAAQAQTGLAAASVELAAAETALDQATQSDADRQAWSDALGDVPVSALPAEAGKALDAGNLVEGAAFKKAKDRIAADIPAELLQRAKARRAQAAAPIAQAGKNTNAAEDAIFKERETNGGLEGKAAKKWISFQRAEAAARDFVNNAPSSFDQAKSTLQQVGDPTRAPLTSEQRARINDTDLSGDRIDAATAEEVLHTGAAKDVEEKQILLDEAILKAKAEPTQANIDAVATVRGDLTILQQDFKTADDLWRATETALAEKVADVEEMEVALAQAIQQAVAAGDDPETDPAVIDAKSDLTTAQNNLTSAEVAYKASDHGLLDLWEAAVPDATWRLFEDYEEAVATLTALFSSNPATLKTNLKDFEEAYVAAQLAADRSAAVLAQLTAERDLRTAKQTSARQSADARLFSALRGDE